MACQCNALVPSALPSASRRHSNCAVQALTGASLIGGLLSSSCCVIQLLLNSLQLGCAGFAVLTPWTTHFRALTLLALGHLIYRGGLTRRSILTVAFTLGLMFSQDVVLYSNTMAGIQPTAPPAQEAATSQHPQEPLAKPRHSDASTAADSPGDATSKHPGPGMPAQSRNNARKSGTSAVMRYDPTSSWEPTPQDSQDQPRKEPKTLYLRLEVEGIKCEGCAARLKDVLLRQPGVERCAVHFATKQVLVWGQVGLMDPATMLGAIRFVDLSYKPTLVESWEL